MFEPCNSQGNNRGPCEIFSAESDAEVCSKQQRWHNRLCRNVTSFFVARRPEMSSPIPLVAFKICRRFGGSRIKNHGDFGLAFEPESLRVKKNLAAQNLYNASGNVRIIEYEAETWEAGGNFDFVSSP